MEESFYKLTASAVLWWTPLMFAAILAQEWQTSARIPLILVVGFALAVRGWVRVGSLSVSAHHHFRFTGTWYDEAATLEDIAWVFPLYRASGQIGFWMVLKPVWRRPVLLAAPIPEAIVQSWAKAGVRVVGLSPEDDARADNFFSQ